MRITHLLRESRILLNAHASTKAEAIHTMVGLLSRDNCLGNTEDYEHDVLMREAQGSTGVGGGVAIPHAKSVGVSVPALAAMTLAEPLDYDSLDGAPVRLLFMIAVPDTDANLHIRVLADLARLLMQENFCASLLNAPDPASFLQILVDHETPRPAPDAGPEQAQSSDGTPYDVLAVTACPMGIAHTYMAAQALERQAAAMGLRIKVETHGAEGPSNILTPAEIAAATCIVVAADRTVDTSRFAGRPVLFLPVADALRSPGKLLQRAMSGGVPIMSVPEQGQPAGDAPPSRWETPGVILGIDLRERGRHGYAHLMTGLNHMIPFVTGGGILIALSYFLDRANVGDLTFGSGTSLSWLVGQVGEYTLRMMYPIMAGFVGTAMAGPAALVPGMMGGYLALLGMTVAPFEGWVSSGFWGALLAGFVSGWLVRALRKLCSRLPAGLDPLKTTLIYPVLGLALMGAFMVLVINPPLGRFNQWLYNALDSMRGGSSVAMGALLGAMMAVDFGGPINKAAYLFGTVTLGDGTERFMASVMAGGMVPPLGVALACTLFPKRFTTAERNSTLTNYLLGASFITEGALPFALRDPLRVIPSCMAGSALAGALSMLFGCGVPAPHGGLYLLPLADHRLSLLGALAMGAALTAALLGLLKQDAEPEEADASPAAAPQGSQKQ